jgi:hypothetical protein
MTNTARWTFRYWLLFTLGWLGVVGEAQQDELCAALLWRTPKEISDHSTLLERDLASPGLSSEARIMIIADHGKYIEPRPARSCLPTNFSVDQVRRTGGYSIDWSVRLPALGLWLVPPVLVLLTGLLLLWAAGAFHYEE